MRTILSRECCEEVAEVNDKAGLRETRNSVNLVLVEECSTRPDLVIERDFLSWLQTWHLRYFVEGLVSGQHV